MYQKSMELRSRVRRPGRYRESDDEDEYLPPKPVFVLPTIPYDPTLPPAVFPTIPLDAYPPEKQVQSNTTDPCNNLKESGEEDRQLQFVHLVRETRGEMEKGPAMRWEATGEPGDFNNLIEVGDEESPRAPYLKGVPADGGEPVEEEYDGWVPREVKNAEGQMETRYFVKASAIRLLLL
jgi:hypothetical protein